MADSFIYLITSEEGNVFKIGISNNPTKRQGDLQCSNSNKLHLLYLVEGDKALETNLHNKFKSFHVQGEWFKGDLSILKHFQEIGMLQNPKGLYPFFLMNLIPNLSNRNLGILYRLILLDKAEYDLSIRDYSEVFKIGINQVTSTLRELQTLKIIYKEKDTVFVNPVITGKTVNSKLNNLFLSFITE